MTAELDETEERLDPDERIAQAAREAAPRYGLDPEELARRTLAARDRRLLRAAQPVKRCSACDVRKPGRDFAEDARTADGLDSRCKACKAAQERARYASRSSGEGPAD